MAIRVTWQPSPTEGVSSYELERSLSPNGPWAAVANVLSSQDPTRWDGADGVYFYNDATGTDAFYYRVTVVDGDGARSGPSVPFRASVDIALALAKVIGATGEPVRTTFIVSGVGAKVLADFLVIGQTKTYETDAAGSVAIPMIRGARVVVAIDGTTVVRELDVPDESSFDLMHALTATPDMFTIQELPPLVSRRSF